MVITVDENKENVVIKKTCNMLMTVYWENARMNIEIVNLCKGEKDVKVKYRPTDNKRTL